jgi:hypothetical protein
MRLYPLGIAGRTVHLAPLTGRGRIASAIRVRGSFHKRGGDRFKNACHIPQHIVVPEPQDTIVVVDKPFVADSIAKVLRVLASIHLNNESAFPADEINRVGAYRLLPDELVPVETARSKPMPQSGFSICGSSPQTPGTLGLVLVGRAHAETPPHPARFARRPLPASGARLASRQVQ